MAKNVYGTPGRVAALYSTPGVRIDFAKHSILDTDPDTISDALVTALVSDSPVQCLETTIVTTGALQTLSYRAPIRFDTKSSQRTRLFGYDISMALNPNNVPTSDFNFLVEFLNAAGVTLPSMTQQVTGTVSISDGSNRQMIRFLTLEQNSTYTSAGVGSVIDGRVFAHPDFRATDAAAYAALKAATALTDTQLAQLYDTFAYDVDTIKVTLPLNAFTSGVVVTFVPITAGRVPTVLDMIDQMDEVGNAGTARNPKFIDLGIN